MSFDICIVGAGPAGSTAAYLLARQGFSVALVDRAAFPRDKTCGDGITPRGARLLERIGVLGPIRTAGFACRGVDVRGDGPGGTTLEFTMPFDRSRANEPSELIVLPRLSLDALLLEHALGARPTLFDRVKVTGLDTHASGVSVLADGKPVVDAQLVILATGAESQLLRASGLLDAKPPLEHAARAYFDGVDGLTDRVVLFFDGVDLPGYGWVFPTSSTSANVGCGVFATFGAGRPMPQAQRLERLVASHPMLVRMLKNATRDGQTRAYPLRTDFHARHAGRDRVLVIGEAAGLVNPITGEGIDYALESGEFAAEAITAFWPATARAAGVDTATARRITASYRRRLSRRFTVRMSLYRAVQRHALAPERIPTLLAHVAQAPRLQRLVIDGLFGRARPAHLLRPSTLWDIARLLAPGRWAGRFDFNAPRSPRPPSARPD